MGKKGRKSAEEVERIVAQVEAQEPVAAPPKDTETKKRIWVGILYVENLREDWKAVIDDVLDLPFAYCVHDKDLDKDGDCRKEHVHLMVAWPGPTTYTEALRLMSSLSAPGKRAINKVEAVRNVRKKYNYLIHATAKAREAGKHQYDPSERITGNNFDIGAYEQISLVEKQRMRQELSKLIAEKEITNYADFYVYVLSNFEPDYEDVVVCFSSHFTRMINGVWQKVQERLDSRHS